MLSPRRLIEKTLPVRASLKILSKGQGLDGRVGRESRRLSPGARRRAAAHCHDWWKTTPSRTRSLPMGRRVHAPAGAGLCVVVLQAPGRRHRDGRRHLGTVRAPVRGDAGETTRLALLAATLSAAAEARGAVPPSDLCDGARRRQRALRVAGFLPPHYRQHPGRSRVPRMTRPSRIR